MVWQRLVNAFLLGAVRKLLFRYPSSSLKMLDSRSPSQVRRVHECENFVILVIFEISKWLEMTVCGSDLKDKGVRVCKMYHGGIDIEDLHVTGGWCYCRSLTGRASRQLKRTWWGRRNPGSWSLCDEVSFESVLERLHEMASQAGG